MLPASLPTPCTRKPYTGLCSTPPDPTLPRPIHRSTQTKDSTTTFSQPVLRVTTTPKSASSLQQRALQPAPAPRRGVMHGLATPTKGHHVPPCPSRHSWPHLRRVNPPPQNKHLLPTAGGLYPLHLFVLPVTPSTAGTTVLGDRCYQYPLDYGPRLPKALAQSQKEPRPTPSRLAPPRPAPPHHLRLLPQTTWKFPRACPLPPPPNPGPCPHARQTSKLNTQRRRPPHPSRSRGRPWRAAQRRHTPAAAPCPSRPRAPRLLPPDGHEPQRQRLLLPRVPPCRPFGQVAVYFGKPLQLLPEPGVGHDPGAGAVHAAEGVVEGQAVVPHEPADAHSGGPGHARHAVHQHAA